MDGMYENLDRPTLSARALNRALAPDGWRIEVLSTAGSTNEVVAGRVRDGEPAGLVVVAEQQTAGRGRLARQWVSPPRAGLTMSVLLRPDLPVARWPWLPLWGGLAVARALRERAGVGAVLKWPNDVLIGDRKVCGVLAEVQVPGALVLGIGLNVSTRADELPHAGASSLLLENATTTDRDTLLRAVLRTLTAVLREQPIEGYRALCSTTGRQVRVELPAGRSVVGLAEAVDDAGRLVVAGEAYGVGDVIHVRSEPDEARTDAVPIR